MRFKWIAACALALVMSMPLAVSAMEVRALGIGPHLVVNAPDGSRVSLFPLPLVTIAPPMDPSTRLELGGEQLNVGLNKRTRELAMDLIARDVGSSANLPGRLTAASNYQRTIVINGHLARVYLGRAVADGRPSDYQLILVDIGHDRVWILMFIGDVNAPTTRVLMQAAMNARVEN